MFTPMLRAAFESARPSLSTVVFVSSDRYASGKYEMIRDTV
jgi:hypothetical protein